MLSPIFRVGFFFIHAEPHNTPSQELFTTFIHLLFRSRKPKVTITSGKQVHKLFRLSLLFLWCEDSKDGPYICPHHMWVDLRAKKVKDSCFMRDCWGMHSFKDSMIARFSENNLLKESVDEDIFEMQRSGIQIQLQVCCTYPISDMCSKYIRVWPLATTSIYTQVYPNQPIRKCMHIYKVEKGDSCLY